MIGNKTIKNENSAACSLLMLQNNAVTIVNPDLDIPGSIAMACANPIINACVKVMLLFDPLRVVLISNIHPVNTNITQTKYPLF